jgi:hypothetical protein
VVKKEGTTSYWLILYCRLREKPLSAIVNHAIYMHIIDDPTHKSCNLKQRFTYYTAKQVRSRNLTSIKPHYSA